MKTMKVLLTARSSSIVAAALLAVSAPVLAHTGPMAMIGEASGYPYAADNATSTTTAYGEVSGPLSRADVRDELLAAQRSGTLTPMGEVGDTPVVLAAREAFNVAQANQIMARYEAQRQAAIAAANAAAVQTLALAPASDGSAEPAAANGAVGADTAAAPMLDAAAAPGSEVPPAESLAPSEELVKPEDPAAPPQADLTPDMSVLKQEESPESDTSLAEPKTD